MNVQSWFLLLRIRRSSESPHPAFDAGRKDYTLTLLKQYRLWVVQQGRWWGDYAPMVTSCGYREPGAGWTRTQRFEATGTGAKLVAATILELSQFLRDRDGPDHGRNNGEYQHDASTCVVRRITPINNEHHLQKDWTPWGKIWPFYRYTLVAKLHETCDASVIDNTKRLSEW